ncbi:hypothetical protein EGW08_003861 [Elysia chlorotica]|uniref:AAA+ ATPase domain-containing protein n=1 Tax=Elysia chlorotica TaxID=188477 RepID=A0A433U3M0_ELYCH|nr:hypothetical protein EGW08_003861 [Elysia chlorotica]
MEGIIDESDDELPDPSMPDTQDPDVRVSSIEREEHLPVKTVNLASKSAAHGKDVVPESESCSSDADDMIFTPINPKNRVVNMEKNSTSRGVKKQEISKSNSNCLSKDQSKRLELPGQINIQTKTAGTFNCKRQPLLNFRPNSIVKLFRNSATETDCLSTTCVNVKKHNEHCDSSSDEGSDDSCSFFSQVSTMLEKKTKKDHVDKTLETARSESSTSRTHMTSSPNQGQQGKTDTSPVFLSRHMHKGTQRLHSSLDSTETAGDVGPSRTVRSDQSELELQKNSELPFSHTVSVSEPPQGSSSVIVKKESEDDDDNEKSASPFYQVADDGSLYVFDSEDEEIFLSQMIQHGSLESEDLEGKNDWDDDDDWLAQIECNEEHGCSDVETQRDNYFLTSKIGGEMDEEEDKPNDEISSFRWQQRSEGSFMKNNAMGGYQRDSVDDEDVSDNGRTEEEIQNSKLNHLQAECDISDDDLFNRETQCMQTDAEYESSLSSGHSKVIRKSSNSLDRDNIYKQSASSSDPYNIATQVITSDIDYDNKSRTQSLSRKGPPTCDFSKSKGGNTSKAVNYSAFDADPYSMSTQPLVYVSDDDDPFCVQTLVSEQPQYVDIAAIKNEQIDRRKIAVRNDSSDCDPYCAPTQPVVNPSSVCDSFGTETLASEAPHENNFQVNPASQTASQDPFNAKTQVKYFFSSSDDDELLLKHTLTSRAPRCTASNKQSRKPFLTGSLGSVYGQETQITDLDNCDLNEQYLQETQVVDGGNSSDEDLYDQTTQIIENYDGYDSYHHQDSRRKIDNKAKNGSDKKSQNHKNIHCPVKQDDSAVTDDSYDGDDSSGDESTDASCPELQDSTSSKLKGEKTSIKYVCASEKNNVKTKFMNNKVHQPTMSHKAFEFSRKDMPPFNSNHIKEDSEEDYNHPTQIIVSESSDAQESRNHQVVNLKAESETNSDDDFYMLPTQKLNPNPILQDDRPDQLPKYAHADNEIENFQVANEEDSDDVYNCQTQMASAEQKSPQPEGNLSSEKNHGLKDLDVVNCDDDDVYNLQTQICNSDQYIASGGSEKHSSSRNLNNKSTGQVKTHGFTNVDEDDVYCQPTQIVHNVPTSSSDSDVKELKVSSDIKHVPNVSTSQLTGFKVMKERFKNIFGGSLSQAVGKKEGPSNSSSLSSKCSRLQTVNASDELSDVVTNKQSSINESPTEDGRSFKPDKGIQNVAGSKSNLCDPLSGDTITKSNVLSFENNIKRNLFDRFNVKQVILQNDPSYQPRVIVKDFSAKLPQTIHDRKKNEMLREDEQVAIGKKRTKVDSQSEGAETKRQKTDRVKDGWLSVKASTNSMTVTNTEKRKREESGKEQASRSLNKRRKVNSSGDVNRLNNSIAAAKAALKSRCHSKKGEVSKGVKDRHSVRDNNHNFEDAVMPSTQDIMTLGLPIMDAVLPVNKLLLSKGLPSRELKKADKDLLGSDEQGAVVEMIDPDENKKDNLSKTSTKSDHRQDGRIQKPAHCQDGDVKSSSSNQNKSVRPPHRPFISREGHSVETFKVGSSANHPFQKQGSSGNPLSQGQESSAHDHPKKQGKSRKHSHSHVHSSKNPEHPVHNNESEKCSHKQSHSDKQKDSKKYPAHKKQEKYIHKHTCSDKRDGSSKNHAHKSHKSEKHSDSKNQSEKASKSDSSSKHPTHKQGKYVKDTHDQAPNKALTKYPSSRPNESMKTKHIKVNLGSKEKSSEKHHAGEQVKTLKPPVHVQSESVKTSAHGENKSVMHCALKEDQHDKLVIYEQEDILDSAPKSNHFPEFSADEENDCASASLNRQVLSAQNVPASKPAGPERQKDNISSFCQGLNTHGGEQPSVNLPLTNSNKPSLILPAPTKNIMIKSSHVDAPGASHAPPVFPGMMAPHRGILKKPMDKITTGAHPQDRRVIFKENSVWSSRTPDKMPNQFRASNQIHQSVPRKAPSAPGHIGNFKTDMIQSLLRWNPSWLEEQRKFQFVKKDPPPVLGEGKSNWQLLQGLRLYYNSPVEYAKITSNLLKLELWEGMFNKWCAEEKNRTSSNEMKNIYLRLVQSENEPAPNGCSIGICQVEGFCSDPSFILFPGDVLILRAKNDNKKTTNGHSVKQQFACVTSFRRINQERLGHETKRDISSHVVAFDLKLETKIQLLSSTKGSLIAVKLCSVTSDERQIEVLNSVQHNQFMKQLIADPKLSKHIFYHHYLDQTIPSLNREQAKAVCTIKDAVHRSGDKVFILQGPPGTGKSHTIMVLIYEILRGSAFKKRICLATPSNAAVDELAQRIINLSQKNQRAGNPGIKMIRIGKENIDHNIRPYSLKNKTEKQALLVAQSRLPESVKAEIKFYGDKIQHLESQVGKVGAAEGAAVEAELHKIRKKLQNLQAQPNGRDNSYAERLVLQESHVICGTLSSFGQPRLHSTISSLDAGEPFGCIIVDEATQAKEVECLIPLQFNCRKVVLVGDQKQLQPTVLSRKAQEKELSRSLFTRLHMCLTQRDTGEGGDGSSSTPVLSLCRQYRMADAILKFPNEAFYGKKLFTDETVQAKRNSNPYKLAQYLVFDIADSIEQEGNAAESMSTTNPIEAECTGVLCSFVNDAIRRTADRQNRIVCQERIGVISPYRMQKKEIERQLQKRNLRKIAVETVDAFQGQEKDVIIMSCVRAQSNPSTVGFLAEQERMNVSLTRARQALYILGHFNTLKRDPLWRALYQDAMERGVLVSVPSARNFSSIARIEIDLS